MKRIYANLKRFDIPRDKNGISTAASTADFGSEIVSKIEKGLRREELEYLAIFFPEAHILSAVSERKDGSLIKIGCQGVYREDVAKGGNFGAFTTNRTAVSAVALGCDYTLIGHCEERRDKLQIMQEAGKSDTAGVSRILGKEVKAALQAGLKVLFCIGETAEEQPRQEEILKAQLIEGLEGVDLSEVTIGYEPVWAIGTGKTATAEQANEVCAIIRATIGQLYGADSAQGLTVQYGGSMNAANAAELLAQPDVDGGLIGGASLKSADFAAITAAAK